MTPKESCEKEIVRTYNKFYNFCDSSDSDDLKDLLSTLCSSFEKLETLTEEKYKDNHRFIAMKALRNFATHESELLNTSKALSIESLTQTFSEVQLLCLLPQGSLDYVLKNLRSNFTKKCIGQTVVEYDEFVDLYPSIFNLTVDLYFLVKKHSLSISGDGFLSISNAITYEANNGYSHYIDGRIIMLDDSDINVFLKASMIEINEKVAEKNSLPVDNDGLYSGISAYDKSPLEQVKQMNPDDKKYILQRLLDTNAIEVKANKSEGRVGYMNRELHPIELVIANQYLETL